MKKLILLCILTGFLSVIIENTTADAQVPKILNYQAVLKADNGDPIIAKTGITFSLYDNMTGGTMLWTEFYELTPVEGYINVYLGTQNPMNLPFDLEYYLEIKVGDGDPYPRTPLSSVPYAMYALSATNAEHSNSADIASSVEDGVITQEKLAPGVKAIPSGLAGGDLLGQYPNPILKNGAVSTQAIQDLAVTGPKIKSKSVTASHIVGTNGSTNDVLKILNSSTGEVGWGTLSAGGNASGDLSGTYPAPLVSGLKGRQLSSVAPTDNQAYLYDAASGSWTPKNIGLNEINATFMNGSKPTTIDGNGSFLYYRYGGSGDADKMTWSLAPGNQQIPVWNAATKTFYWTDLNSGSASTLDEAYEGGNIINVDAGTPVRIIGIGSDGSAELEVSGDTKLSGPVDVSGNVVIGTNLTAYTFTINGNNVVHDAMTIGSDVASDVSGTMSNLQIKANAVGTNEIATDGVGSAEIATDAVGSDEIATGAVDSDEIAAGAVGSSEMDLTADYAWTGLHTYGNGTSADKYTFYSNVPPAGNDATLIAQNADVTGLALKVLGRMDVSSNLNASTLTLTTNLSANEMNIDGATLISNAGVLEVGTIDAANLDLTATYNWTGSHTFTDANDLEYVFYSNVPANANDAAMQIRNDIAGGLALFVNGNAKVDDRITVGNGTLNNSAISATNNAAGSPTASLTNSGGRALNLTSTGNSALYIDRTDGGATNDALYINRGGITLNNGVITSAFTYNGASGMLTLLNDGTGHSIEIMPTGGCGSAIDILNLGTSGNLVGITQSMDGNAIDITTLGAGIGVNINTSGGTNEAIRAQAGTDNAITAMNNSGANPTINVTNSNAAGKAIRATSTGGYALELNRTDGGVTNDALYITNGGITLNNGAITNVSTYNDIFGMVSLLNVGSGHGVYSSVGAGRALDASNNSATNATVNLDNANGTDDGYALSVSRGGVKLAYIDATGVADLTNYGDYSVIQITVNITTPPAGDNGQVLYLYNSDAALHTFASGTIQAGEVGMFIYVGAWKQVDDDDE